MLAIAQLSAADLARALTTQQQKLAFWMNVYNAGIQRTLRTEPGLYRHRLRFFGRNGVTVAGHQLSFNAIEHGLLRRSMFAYSLGYAANPIPGSFERQFRVDVRDARVHFALNCGAASCPPIAAYDAELVDGQLDIATASYLAAECAYDAASNSVTVPRLLLWFRGDFGGKQGILELLRRYECIPPGAAPRLRYARYDWTLSVG